MDLPGGGEDPLDRGQLPAVQHAAFDPEPGERARDVGNSLGLEPVAAAKQAGRLAHPGELLADPGDVIGGPAPAHPVGARGAGGQRRDPLDHLGQLDGLEGLG